ncbi:MAG: FtsQ-type POTRA domain-containing protein [Acidobacteria bacterium]|nr:FtsQ-type POTRA domain-containing protein [Acidobacteriota bacterium]
MGLNFSEVEEPAKGVPVAARRQPVKQRGARTFLLDLFQFLGRAVLVAAPILLGWFVYRQAFQTSAFQLQHIVFSGQRYADMAGLEELIREGFDRNLLRIDLRKLRASLEAEPWIAGVQVRRVLPHTLKVDLQERLPAAIARIPDELFLVDREGVLLDRYGPRYGKIDTPVVQGLWNADRKESADQNRIRMELYLRVLRDLDSGAVHHSAHISEMDLSDPEDVVVLPNDQGVLLHLGTRSFRQRFEAYLQNQEQLKDILASQGPVDSIDLRYENQIVFHRAAAKPPP